MPLYEYRCPQCQEKFEEQRKLAEYQTPAYCGRCRIQADRILSPVQVNPDISPYRCPVTDKVITSRRAHEDNLKRTNSRVMEPGEHIDIMRKRHRRDELLETKIGDTVGREIASWSQEKQSKLAQEMEHGADLKFNRSTPYGSS